MYLMQLNCTPKTVKMINFYDIYILPQLLKKHNILENNLLKLLCDLIKHSSQPPEQEPSSGIHNLEAKQ